MAVVVPLRWHSEALERVQTEKQEMLRQTALSAMHSRINVDFGLSVCEMQGFSGVWKLLSNVVFQCQRQKSVGKRGFERCSYNRVNALKEQ